ncbi:hypothetical protein ACRAWF_15315 [Streptomyces sp. L7]
MGVVTAEHIAQHGQVWATMNLLNRDRRGAGPPSGAAVFDRGTSRDTMVVLTTEHPGRNPLSASDDTHAFGDWLFRLRSTPHWR